MVMFLNSSSQIHCEPGKQGAALCWLWGNPTLETLQVTHVTSITQYQHLHTSHSMRV